MGKEKGNAGIELQSVDYVVEVKYYTWSCFAKARDYLTLLNLRMLCLDEGFGDFEIQYVGGLWVLFEFKMEMVCHNFLSNEAMDNWLM